mmetsp:Transcript_17353/g.53766  ORF Transcript_17353/g.53766 Transcript_17353/m.53766 type:complete len:208 (+) Transcript_17353:208-831(+)
MPPKPLQNWLPSCERLVTNSSVQPNFLYSSANHSSSGLASTLSRSTPVSLSWNENASSCAGLRLTTCSSPVAELRSTWRMMSRFSHTMSVSTAPISRQHNVSRTPNTYLPVSWLISSKNLDSNFFSWTNLTLARHSALSSMACAKPFSPPYETSTMLSTTCLSRMSKSSDSDSTVLKSAEPARMSPATLGLSLVINICVHASAVLRT